MTAFQITNLKLFMKKLLTSESFDIFLLEEAVIAAASTITIDGHVNKKFYQGEEQDTLSPLPPFRPWSEMRGLCFELIRGKRTPLFFRFTFQLKPELAERLLRETCSETDPAQIETLAVNIRYDGAKATLTTATAARSFFLSKEPDTIWDRALKQFLDKEGIAWEIL